MSAPEQDIPEVEVVPEPSVAVAVRPVQMSVVPAASSADLVERLDAIREAMNTAMTRDVDYGVIPGTGSKPTLLKPGAEKLGVLFQLDVQLVNAKTYGPGDHLTVESTATVYHAPTGARVGFGEGLCTTREKKYGKRQEQRVCPDCGEAAIIKGRDEYGGGWLCFAKKGGCGHKWADGAEVIESQTVGEIDNPDLPDLWNTVVKMAEKRARVDAILAVTGASALFTQDAEDLPRPETNGAEPTPVPRPTRAVTADAPQATERTATAKQRGLLNGKASEKGLSAGAFAAIILEATGSEAKTFDTDDAASDWLRRAMDRLPAKAVNPILAAIEKVEAPQ